MHQVGDKKSYIEQLSDKINSVTCASFLGLLD